MVDHYGQKFIGGIVLEFEKKRIIKFAEKVEEIEDEIEDESELEDVN